MSVLPHHEGGCSPVLAAVRWCGATETAEPISALARGMALLASYKSRISHIYNRSSASTRADVAGVSQNRIGFSRGRVSVLEWDKRTRHTRTTAKSGAFGCLSQASCQAGKVRSAGQKYPHSPHDERCGLGSERRRRSSSDPLGVMPIDAHCSGR